MKIFKPVVAFLITFGVIALMFYWGFNPPGDWYYLFILCAITILPMAARIIMPIMRIMQTSQSASSKKEKSDEASEKPNRTKATATATVDAIDDIDDFTSIWLD